eukprot:7933489-Alexandrium_andersonii.AAC.1
MAHRRVRTARAELAQLVLDEGELAVLLRAERPAEGVAALGVLRECLHAGAQVRQFALALDRGGLQLLGASAEH